MKARIQNVFLLPALLATLIIFIAPTAQAGLTMQMQLNRYGYGGNSYSYFIGPNLNTNSTPPNVPYGDYLVTSPAYPSNGNASVTLFHFDTNGFNQVYSSGGAFSYFDAPDFYDSCIQNLTNGHWSIFVTNAVTTNVYYFTVTATIDSNSLPPVIVTFPTNGAMNVPYQPAITWQGPTNYSDLIVYDAGGNYLPATQTSWQSSTLPGGINNVNAHYDLFTTNDLVVCSVPMDSGSNAISSWLSELQMTDIGYSQFTVGNPDVTGKSNALVAYYTWDNTNGDGSASGTDNSSNGYDMNFGGSFGAAGGVNWTTDAAIGPGAIQFIDGDGNSGGYVGWNPMQTNVLAALAGSFSISCWINTTQNFDNNGDYAFNGAGIVSAYTGGLANDVIPLALTGSQVAFNTGGDVEDDTLNSNGSVNDGNYHHVVVTRNQLTGQKIIYIDGQLDSFGTGTTNLLTDCHLLTIGSLADATDPNATDANYYNGYNGILDDLQIYSGVLSAAEVAYLYNNPGATAANNGDSITVTASPQNGTAPLTVQFTSPSVDSLGNPITSWNWNFGDGTTSTEQNPSHTYGNIGFYLPNVQINGAGNVFPLVTGPGAINVTETASTFIANLPGTPESFTYGNFNVGNSIQVNGSAANVTTSDGPVIELTQSGSTQAGSAFSGNPISLTPNVGFSTFFTFRLGSPANGSPGDGITFTIQGDNGFAVGAVGSGAGDSGISNSLSVEFDAFNSGTQSASPGGISANQVQIITNFNGATGVLASVPVTNAMNDGNIWYAWVDYSGVSQDLQVRLAEVPIRPLAPTLDTTVNLPSILGVTNVLPAGGNLLNNGGFESEPNWGSGGIYYDGEATALTGNEVPGWTIEPNHALTIHKAGGYLTISGMYSANTDGEGYDRHNANFYQDFATGTGSNYTLSFNWQSWGIEGDTAPETQLKVSVTDTVTGGTIFNGLYSYDIYTKPVHLVTTNFPGTGNPLRLRIEESPESGINDDMYVVDNFSVAAPPRYANAYVGFTGGGGNQQDILSWKFTALPTMHLTGHFALTNVSTNFSLTNGVVAKVWAYRINSIWYTNFYVYPVKFTMNEDDSGQNPIFSADYDSGPVDSPVPPFVFQLPSDFDKYLVDEDDEDQILDQGDLNWLLAQTVLSQYRDYLVSIGELDGMDVPFGKGQTAQDLLARLNGEDWTVAFPGYSEEDMQDLLEEVGDSDPSAGDTPLIYNFIQNPMQLGSGALSGAYGPTLQQANDDGDYCYDDETWSVGQFRGTVAGREQMIYTPPWSLVLLSPRTDGTNFIFNFQSVTNQSYTIWCKTNFMAQNWMSYSNLIGDGYMQKVATPLTNGMTGFYRLTSP